MATVLVVDDEPDLCELVRISLEMDGHTVLVAHDGPTGLAAAEEHQPDLILLDVMMPGADGFAILESMKAASAGTATTPVVMLTARADALDRAKGGIEGAVRYQTKPFSPAELRATVADVLAGGDERALRRQAQTEALRELARLDGGSDAVTGLARPRLTRYEPAGGRASSPPSVPGLLERYRSSLTERQAALLDAALRSPDLRSAAASLGLSRSYVYASLGRIARKLGAESGPDLLRQIREDAESRSLARHAPPPGEP